MMKLIVLLMLALLCPRVGFGTPNWYPLGKDGAGAIYTDQVTCESTEKWECFDMWDEAKGEFRDPRKHESKEFEIDDKAKPIFKDKYRFAACADSQECMEVEIAEGGGARCNNGDIGKFSKNILMPGYSLYCTKVVGHEKKKVKRVVRKAK